MLTVAVASTNPVKVEAVRNACLSVFLASFALETCSVDTGVGQPVGETQTERSVLMRVGIARDQMPFADVWIALENGVITREGHPIAGVFNVGLVAARTRWNDFASCRTMEYPVRDDIANTMRTQRVGLAEATRIVLGENDLNRGIGLIGHETNGLITRKSMFEDAAAFVFCRIRREIETREQAGIANAA